MKRDILLRSASGPYSPLLSDYANEIVRLRKAAAAWKAAAKGYRAALWVCDRARESDLATYGHLVQFYRQSAKNVQDYVECPDCAHRQEATLPEYYDIGNVTCEKCGLKYTVTLVQYLVESSE